MPAYLASTAVLAGAAITSQVVSFAGTVINARLYGPLEVGVFGLFNAVFGFALLTASWRYELAIVTVDDDEQAEDVALFVVFVGSVAALVAAILLLAMAAVPGTAEISLPLRRALLALPPTLVLASLILAGTNLCVRQRRFSSVAIQQVVLTAVTAAAQMALVDVDLPGGGLVMGFVLGQLAAMLVLARPLIPVLARRAHLPDLRGRIFAVARSHRGHFFYTIPYSLMTQLYYQAPVMMLGGLFGAGEVGLFSLAYRTTTTPFGLIPNAVGQVLFPEMARDRQRLGRWEPRLQTLLVAFGVLFAPAVAAILVFGPELYALVLGERWRAAGLSAQLLIVPNLMTMLGSGYDRIYFILERQRTALVVIGIGCAFSGLLMLGADWSGGTPAWLVGGWAAGHLVLAFVWMVTVYRIAGFSVLGLVGRWATILTTIGLLVIAMVLGQGVRDAEPWSVALVVATAMAYAAVVLRVAAPLRSLLRSVRRDVDKEPEGTS